MSRIHRLAPELAPGANAINENIRTMHYRRFIFLMQPIFIIFFALVLRPAGAQFIMPAAGTRFELADGVELDRAEGAVLAQLERVKAFLADQKWDEAVDTLCQLMENSEGKLLGVTENRFVGLREYCQMQLASLPPEALKLYRSRIDPVARKWYEDGVANHDPRLLRKVVEQAFASSWGDDALLALGDMALESGDYTAARWYWERIIPHPPPAGQPSTWSGISGQRYRPGRGSGAAGAGLDFGGFRGQGPRRTRPVRPPARRSPRPAGRAGGKICRGPG